ncbi:MAG: DNA-binding protein [Lachnospiraceae bacterium]|nr:DNA-binding protein [Lachnospiraceae bacterium]
MKDVRNEALLFDFYGSLLKGRQRDIYEASVMDDMSLSEISEEYGISRQAVSAMLNRCRKALMGYEEQLQLIKRFEEIGAVASEIKEIAGRLDNSDSAKIVELTDRILGDL